MLKTIQLPAFWYMIKQCSTFVSCNKKFSSTPIFFIPFLGGPERVKPVAAHIYEI